MQNDTPNGFYETLTYGGKPFVGATLKIKRAKRHIHELTNAARELPRLRPYDFVMTKCKSGKLDIIFIPQNIMPLEFAAVVGDAFHNLRAALDYVTKVITCPPFGSGDPEHVYFPTGKDQQKFILARDGRKASSTGKAIRGKMQGASSDACRFVEALEPYDGGKYSVRALHDLDIFDKHKLIVPAVSLLFVNKYEFMLGDKLFSLGGADFKPNADGSNFTATIDCTGGLDNDQFKFRDNFDASFTIVFGKGYPLEGQPIIPTLSNLCDVVEGFIKTCETHFF